MTLLATWMWQGLVVAGAAALLLRAFPRINAATRHAIWWIALVLVVIHPWTPSGVPFEPVAGSGRAADVLSETFLFLPMPPQWMVLGGLAAWMLLVASRTWQIVRGVMVVARLKRQSCALDPTVERGLPMWQATRGSRRSCELRVSGSSAGACALGFWRPVILLPECLTQALSDEELDQVVMHEHAHLARYDDWSRLFQCLVRAFLGLHPAVWLVGTRIDLEREAACDDQVVALTGAPRAYANCLARVAGILLAGQGQQPALVPAATRSSAILRSRVIRLLDGRQHRPSRFGWLPATTCMVILTAVVVGSDQVPALVTFAADASVGATTHAPKPLVHTDRLLSLASSIVPAPASAGAKAHPVHSARSVRPRSSRSVTEVQSATMANKPTNVMASRSVSLESSPRSGLPNQVLLDSVVAVSPQTSNESPPTSDEPPAVSPSPLEAIGTATTRAGVAVAAHAQHAALGVSGWFVGKARSAGRSF